jgi:hypothetical protein
MLSVVMLSVVAPFYLLDMLSQTNYFLQEDRSGLGNCDNFFILPSNMKIKCESE